MLHKLIISTPPILNSMLKYFTPEEPDDIFESLWV